MFYRFKEKKLNYNIIFPRIDKGIVLIYLSGFPTLPKENLFTKYCQEKGITIIMPHYYGSWLSDGNFTPNNLIKTANDVIKIAKKGKAIEQYNFVEKKWKINSIILGGGSFGGLIALLSAQVNNINKIFLSAPLIDLKSQGIFYREENLMHSLEFARRIYKNVYRGIEQKLWNDFFTNKLSKTSINYNKLNEKNILIIHGEKDNTINIKHSVKFASKLKNVKLIKLKNADHRIWDTINKNKLNQAVNWMLKR